MDFLYFLERLRTPLFDSFFMAVTYLGDEIFFIAAALFVFWCVNKNMGYYLLTSCFFGIVLNQTAKLFFKVPRPWLKDPSFTIVEAARESATGYSFPSGHTQNGVTVFGCIGLGATRFLRTAKQRTVFVAVCILGAVLVGFSRMYLGVHTPYDVLTSAALALTVVCVFKVIFDRVEKNPRLFYVIVGIMMLFAVAYLVYSHSLSGITPDDVENIASGRTHAWYMLGGVLGIAAAYPLESRFVRFDTRAGMMGQILKLVTGFVLVLVIKSVIKQPLLAIFAGHDAAHAVRYFVLVFFAVVLWPMTFGFFADIGKNK